MRPHPGRQFPHIHTNYGNCQALDNRKYRAGVVSGFVKEENKSVPAATPDKAHREVRGRWLGDNLFQLRCKEPCTG